MFRIGYSLYRGGRLAIANKTTAQAALSFVRDLDRSDEILVFITQTDGSDLTLDALRLLAGQEAPAAG